MHHSDRELLKSLSKPVDVRRLIRKLAFDLDTLEEAGMNQPRLRLRAGRLRTQMILQKASRKRQLQAIIGEKSIHIRRKHGNSYTATAIKNELGYDRDVRRAQKEFDTAEALETYAQDLVECYKERSMAIFTLSRLKGSEISSELRAVKSHSELSELRKRAHRMRDRFEGESE